MNSLALLLALGIGVVAGAVLAGGARRGDMGGLPGLVEPSRLPTSKVLHTFTQRRI